MDYCDQLYRLERQYKHLSQGKRRKVQQKQSKPIVEKFQEWVDTFFEYQRFKCTGLVNAFQTLFKGTLTIISRFTEFSFSHNYSVICKIYKYEQE
ncbi:hypothetical protein ABE61_22900 [Lysinibacillus sphaericus]|nr:transposase [Lysinibacillus sphaericus]MBG9456769.1 hypothetical protein [Lysinibacillus sphaericus]MBG9479129.1 hypothetical protein [Lysinibacillus sphaericus]MBG9592716.1 hypothetical protein [Lysinibacillus sphaericus]